MTDAPSPTTAERMDMKIEVKPVNDFLYRFVLPAYNRDGKPIWELNATKQQLEAWIDSLLSSK